ncbi:phosphotransferase [Virgibacillus byunsanensis]|uniref:Phosphotransferase n=1 Tax=Virgibacillus byunsanensis TaxID=570945 RepID=A0ABW3LP85_9BACI
MERRKGIVLDAAFPEEITYNKALGRKISELMVDKLVELHRIDYTKTNLVEIAKPDGFMERQVKGWINRYERSKTDEVPGLVQLTNWLENHIPISPEPTIIHWEGWNKVKRFLSMLQRSSGQEK